MTKLIDRLKANFRIKNVTMQRADLIFLTVPEKQAVSLITYLRNQENFSHLVFLTAVDWIEENKFQLNYMLHNHGFNFSLGIRVMINRQKPVMTSIHHLWEHASTYQRELKEMFGIDFPGSPEIDQNFILEGWEDIPPLRRDFDTLKYSERTYFPRTGRKSHDPRKFMKSKIYPEQGEER
ncbi:MAG: NADH-quinone oxidoreductase subunit C [Candidatus Cloacimonetes bacterium]|nr:NADH-quinone oxidoreductase subunit C [Candidatus Cloacimonadota bacterium]